MKATGVMDKPDPCDAKLLALTAELEKLKAGHLLTPSALGTTAPTPAPAPAPAASGSATYKKPTTAK